MGRCKSTNRCDYCARLAAVENAEMLALDAVDGTGPEVWCVLTTRSADPEPRSFYESRTQLMAALRRRFPGLQASWLVEFTTGYASCSGGVRRPHWNGLLKGVSGNDVPEVRRIVEAHWCRREDADPKAQYVGPITEAGGLMRYLALHFQKEAQAPPPGWSGQRFNCSRGYFGAQTRAQARAGARESLRWKRELYKANRNGLGSTRAAAVAYTALVTTRDWIWCLATERGARVSTTGYDPGAMVLPVDRRRANALSRGLRGVSTMAEVSGVAVAARISAQRSGSAVAVRPAAPSRLSLFSVYVSGVSGAERIRERSTR